MKDEEKTITPERMHRHVQAGCSDISVSINELSWLCDELRAQSEVIKNLQADVKFLESSREASRKNSLEAGSRLARILQIVNEP